MSAALLVLRALLSHWRRRPVELATLLIGLAVATALWSGVQALNAQARDSYDRAAAVLGGGTLSTVTALDGQPFPLADYVTLRRAGWAVSPVLEGEVRVGEARIRVIGIEPLTLPPGAEGLRVGEGVERLTDFLTPPNLALAAPGTILDDRFPALSPEPDLPPGTVLVDIAVAERLLDSPGKVSRLLLPEPRDLPPDLATRLQVRGPERDGDLERLTDSFHLNLTAFGFLSFVVGLFIVYSAIGLAFEQRKPMLRTLRAVGVSARLLTGVLVAELVALALIAGLVGVLAGYAIAAALLPDVAATLRGLYGAGVAGSLNLDASWWAAGVAISVAGALAAAGTSLWRAFHLPLLASAEPQAWLGAQRRGLKLQIAGAALFAAAALGALVFGSGLAAGFAVMGGVLLAAALALPSLLAAILALGARLARRPVPQWLWADARQQLSGLSLALMALMLALAVNVGVGTMVDSFRQTFLGWLDRRLAAEIYVTGADDAQARAITDWLEARPEVGAVLPIWSAETRVRDWPVEVFGFRDHPTYRDNWPLLAEAPDAWDDVAAGAAALVSEQMARRMDLAVGDSVEIPTPDGPWPLRVAAVYSDYGNPSGQMMVAVDAFDARWPDAERRRMAARVAPEAVEPLMADLADAFALDPDAMIDQAALKSFSRDVFEKTFTVTLALNTLTLAVAGIALLTSLLTLSNLRLAQLAPLWAMGLTRVQLARIEIGKALVLAALTALAALPLGLAVAWILTAVINVQAFGWKLPVFLFPGQWADALPPRAPDRLRRGALARMAPAPRLARLPAPEFQQ